MRTRPAAARITRTPPNLCRNCGKLIDSASPSAPADRRRRARPGDIALCLDCGHVHIFADDLTLREPTGDELVEIAGNPDMLRAQAMIGRRKT
jgi:hypothetical protein